MFYRFTRELDNTFTVVLTNAGEGAEKQGMFDIDEKKKVLPFVVFSGVLEEELFIEANG